MKVLKDWIISHKLLSIVIAAVIVVGAASAVVLPIALAHKHEFSAEWTSDADSHWHACAGKDCDEVDGKADHVYDNACDDSCNVCGATRTVGAHVYDNACDATCNVCGATRTVEDHKFVTKHDATKHWQECSVCKYVKEEVAHTFETKHDDKNHWQECSCGYKKEEVAHVFETKHDDTKHWLECSCGYKKDEAKHSLEAKHDATKHWQECSCGYKTGEAAHDYGAWAEKTAADYGVDKVETRACSKCSYVDERTVEKSRFEYTGDFYMMITGVINVPGKGVAVSGTVARGTVKENDEVSIGGYEGTLTVKKIEIDKTTVEEATYGDVISVLLGTDVSKGDIEVGQPMYKPGTLTQHTTFTAEIYLKTAEEGGRSIPFFSGYQPNFNFNGLSISGTITLPDGTTMLSPGETAIVTVVLSQATYLRENVTFTAQDKTQTVITGKLLSVKHVEKLTGDSEGHWKVCADCGITLGNPEEKAEHHFSWVLDSETHYQKCDDCGYTTDEAEHTYESDTAIECDDCLRQRGTASLAFKGGVYTVTYNGQAQAFDKENYLESNVDSLDEVTVSYSTSKDGPWTEEPPKDVGTYYIKLSVEANHDHTSCVLVSDEPLLKIQAKTLSLTDLVLTRTPSDLTNPLNTVNIDLTAADIPGIYGNDTLKVSLAYKSGTTFKSGDEYTVKSKFNTTSIDKCVTVSTSGNYTFSNDTTGKLFVINPEAKEVVDYSETVSLSVGDNWFAINITQAAIDDNGDEMSGKFTVDSSSDASAPTITVYNSKWEIVSEDEVQIGSLYCEGLTAGKYYVKICATEALSGTLSITIAV